ncbi:hypothetical protein OIU85_008766, partial [Salix viminalis]
MMYLVFQNTRLSRLEPRIRNRERDTDNLTSDGSPVHRLIDQHSVDYWHSVESVRLLKTLETECS